MNDIPEGALCANCNTHVATVRFDHANLGIMALTHGFYQYWCLCCTVRREIEHIEERVALLPRLREELAEACTDQD